MHVMRKNTRKERPVTETKPKAKNLSRRAALALGASAVAAGAAKLLLADQHDSQEEFETIYTGEDECDEECEELSIGEKIAHATCAVAMTAYGQEDYATIIQNLGLWGKSPGLVTYASRGKGREHIINWAMRGRGYDNSVDGYGAARCFENVVPDPSLPNAQAYTDWVMCKDLDPEIGQYLSDDEIRLPENRAMMENNNAKIPEYTVFTVCGAVPNHAHWVFGLGGCDYCTSAYFGCAASERGNFREDSPLETEQYTIFRCDPEKTWDEQCEPGDVLFYDPTAPGANENYGHWMLYVGNDIAKRYFDKTTANFAEAGAGTADAPNEAYLALTDLGDNRYINDFWVICRPKEGDWGEPRQWVPDLDVKCACAEPCRKLKLGERIAHTAVAISMTAVGQADYAQMLRDLNLYGTKAGYYTYGGGQIAYYTNNDPEWLATLTPEEYNNLMDKWAAYHGCACDYELQAPDRRIPRSKDYIEFTMAKGVDPQYGIYLPEEVVRNPENREQMLYNKKHIAFSGVPCYSRFGMCGTAVEHVLWAQGVDYWQAYACYGNPNTSIKDHPGNTLLEGYTRNGVHYVTTGSPHYTAIYDGHVAGQDPPLSNEWYSVWMVDPTKRWVDQCEPGDFLTVTPLIEGPDQPDYQHKHHGMLYVGNDIVREYFPNSNGIICEAGGGNPDHYWGVTRDVEDLAIEGFKIHRPKNIDTELRQWVPKLPSVWCEP